MRIALFSDTYPPQINGVATATYTLGKVLSQKGNDVLIVTTALEGQKKLTSINNVMRIPGITVKRLYNYKFAGIYNHKVFRMLEAFKPDLIHIQTEVGIGIFGRLASHRMNIPLIYTYHTMYEDYTYYLTKGFEPFDYLAKKGVAFFSSLLGDSTTAFVTTSEKTKDALRRYGAKKYINVVPNGLDMTSYAKERMDPEIIAEIKEKYNLNGKFVLLILGRLAKEKANDLVLKYYASYLSKKKDKDIVLLVVGNGPDKESLEKLAADLHIEKRTVFAGAVDHSEVPYFYSLADLYVSASTSETQGLTYIEAMAAKTLVMARFDNNLLGTIEDGKTGFYFDDESSFIKTIADIREMSGEKKTEIIERAYKNTDERFSLEAFYRRIMNVYDKAIRKYW